MTTTSTQPTELPKAYTPSEHEARIRARWDESGVFHAEPGPVLEGQKKPYSIVIPPPNVTAALHLGHGLNNTLQDVLARVHRMMGLETLWMPGTDHAGIATQTVVEKRLINEGKQPRIKWERDAFVAEVQSFKDEYERVITDQLKMMGCSCDWERQRFTMDETCAKAVREAFFRLFRDGLIYRGKRLVNWDPVTQTVLADDEVEMREVDGFFYYLRYPLCDANGALISVTLPDGATTDHITVATTRPETYLGDTGVAMNPRDPRAKALVGKFVKLPFVGRVIPIVADDYVVLPAAMQADPEAAEKDPKAKYATGFLKVTPAHDVNDEQIGKRHDLAVINVMAPDATISRNHGWGDRPGCDAEKFVGMTREDARKAVVSAFRDAGLLEAQKPYSHSVGHSYRSHAAIEPYLSDQWYIAIKKPIPLFKEGRTDAEFRALIDGTDIPEFSLAGLAQSALLSGELRFVPERYAKTYQTWHENLRDWPISRQLWWGHRIPVWNSALRIGSHQDHSDFHTAITKLSKEGRIAGSTEILLDVPIGYASENRFAGLKHWCVRSADDSDAQNALESMNGVWQDLDVLDTWFSSALWPLSTMGWPNPGADNGDTAGLLDAFNPTNVLCTAREIITLWVSRMVMFNRYFLATKDASGKYQPGPSPFKDVFIHAMIQDGEGRKMSKSLGNGVDPLDIIETHGADAMRFTLCHMTTQTQDVRMPVERDAKSGKNTSPKFDLGRNFCNKLWNASRFAVAKLDGKDAQGVLNPLRRPLLDRWMLSRLATTIEQVNASLRGYEFSNYAQALYDILWRDFCDWYLEGVKPTIDADAEQRTILRASLDSILRVLHPVAPFITETLYERVRELPRAEIAGLSLGVHRSGLLCATPWPLVDPDLRDEGVERDFEKLRGLVDAIRQTRAAQNVPPKRQVTLHLGGDKALAKLVRENEVFVKAMAGLKAIESDAPAGASSVFTFDASEHRLSDLADATDAGAERARLDAKLAELNKSIAALEGRLANPGYADRAPAHLVQQTRDQLAAQQAERDATADAMSKL
ncbi:MAG: valine--tRNA ligase [Phycisphaeraceae bacterium]|nr:valine--tRNA ligase [Phycisphaeraceae bacterium]